MLRRILIANRGEIATRIIRTCERLGIETVAIYASDDADALHVRNAAQAVALDGSSPHETYLDVPRIVAVAREHHCDAVHPGYGFLSENPALPRALAEAGIEFIGPSADTVAAMANKNKARAIAEAAGIPVIPGINGSITRDDILRFGNDVGWPLLVKAAYGGGGRGMREINCPDEIDSALNSARTEAAHAFGNPDIFVELLIRNGRHIEVQVLGDRHGAAVAVGTRDCSVQRRHQKLLEEAPAAGLSDSVHKTLTTAAVDLSAHVGYVGAGTVEFLVDGEEIYFLEMNTRLQVEHTVTEAIFGLDLVEAQLEIAAGGRVPTIGEPNGHAIQFRVNAEDPFSGFLPHPGRIEQLDFPPMPGLRVDTGYLAGDVVPATYDSLVAKVVVHAADRSRALQKLGDVAATAVIHGIPTTLPIVGILRSSPAFREGAVPTQWFESQLLPTLDAADRPSEWGRASDEVSGRGVWIAGRFHRIEGGQDAARPERSGLGRHATSSARPGERAVLTTPMQGTVIAVHAQPGERVAGGGLVVAIEAMKLENGWRAEFDCTVTEIYVEPGQIVKAGTPIAELVAVDVQSADDDPPSSTQENGARS